MLIPFGDLEIKTPVKGVVHIGAHECEERQGYIDNFKIDDSNIIWIEANPDIVNKMRPVYPHATILSECVSSEDNKTVSFMITNNYQSSSILNLKTHKIEHPWVYETNRIELKTKTLNTIFKENNFIHSDYNFMNLDIQGAELLALKGSTEILPFIDYIYCEVNEKELYEGCALLNELDEFLLSHKFKRVLISMTQHGWGDAFYVKIN